MKRISLSFILLFVLAFITMTVLAQESMMYEDPEGRYSVPIPAGWTDESIGEFARYVGPDGISASILALETADAASGDQAILAALAPEIAGTNPVQTASRPSAN